MRYLQGFRPRLKAVDMCGGAGKAAFVIKSCDPDCQVTLVDCSDKMLDIARQKVRKQNIQGLEVVLDDAFSFLARDEKFDLIVFSSAVHHFKDPLALLEAASKRLNDNGLIVTIADPTTLTKTRRYKFFEFMLSDKETKKTKVKSWFAFKNNGETAAGQDFDLAEYQTYTGIDDKKLAYELTKLGLHPMVHMRYPAGEPYLTKIMPWLGLCWAFSMIISPHQVNDHALKVQGIKEQLKREMPFRFQFC